MGEEIVNALGDIGGGILNYFSEQDKLDYQKEQDRRKREALERAASQANMSYDQMMNLLNEYENGRISVADPAMEQEYKQTISNYAPQTYDFEPFSYGAKVEDFINPEAEKIAELAGLKTQAQMAGQGAAKGTGALAGMGYSKWEAARDLYKDAQNQYNIERQQAYQQYGDYIDRMQKKLDTINQGTLNKAQLLGGAVENEQGAKQDYISSLLGLMENKTSTNINANLGAF